MVVSGGMIPGMAWCLFRELFALPVFQPAMALAAPVYLTTPVGLLEFNPLNNQCRRLILMAREPGQIAANGSWLALKNPGSQAFPF